MEEYNNNMTYEQPQVSEAQVAGYLAKVMGWMALGLLTTFVSTLLCLSSQPFRYTLATNPVLYYAIVIAELVVVLAMSTAINKISAAVATVLFMVYSALTGVTMSVFCMLFQTSSIFMIFVLTAAVFLTMALYGFITKKDLTRFGALAFFGLIGIILAGIINMFIRSSMFDLIICIVGIVLFIGLTAYDTQKIKGIYIHAMESGYDEESEPVKKTAIIGALSLYLDFINLFIMLLRVFGKRRG
ncbi:MAG: Bax inhibitor-1/YccA family protein [Oscillospiraceae bacterium]|jgi:FtsH-binding integral membrane protein|nr:Bax inhibitor-1/YccA family protein [Oscillospiraceae bacterium]